MGVQQQTIGKGGRGEGITAVVGIAAVEEHLPANRAIEQPGVEQFGR